MSESDDSQFHEDEDSSYDFFDYNDNTLQMSLKRFIIFNDTKNLEMYLKGRAENPLPCPTDNRGWTLLHVAAANMFAYDSSCIKLLLQYAESILLDVNAQTHEGETALFLASKCGHYEKAKILLEYNCDPNIYKLDGTFPLHAAAKEDEPKLIETLIKHKANVNCQQWEGLTPLHIAVMEGKVKICETLLKNKANPAIKDNEGNTAIHHACQQCYYEVVTILLKYDPDLVNYQNNRGLTPLMYSLMRVDRTVSYHLLDCNTDTSLSTKNKTIALHYAANSGCDNLLKAVLHYTALGAIEEYCFRYAVTVLHSKEGNFSSLCCCAIHQKSVNCMEFLLKDETKIRRSILEAPLIEGNQMIAEISSPLAHLFYIFSPYSPGMYFERFLSLLIEKNLIYVCNFTEELIIKWPRKNVKYMNPFTKDWLDFATKSKYFQLLERNGVTVDYCLQCFGDVKRCWNTFGDVTDLEAYYYPLVTALAGGDVEMFEFYVANSSVLEPRQLVRAFKIEKFSNKIIQLLAQILPLSEISKYCTSQNVNDVYKFITDETEIINLKGLCRSVIRNCIRDVSLEKNISNFKKKINELPLPDPLKNYLAFK